MAENVKITIDVDGSATQVLKNINGALKTLGTDGPQQIKKASSTFDIFVGNLAAGVALKALDGITSAANKLFQTFIVDGIKAAQAEEVALNQLNQALVQTGQFSNEAAEDVRLFADELSRKSIIDGEAIISGAALAQSFTKNTEETKALTAAAADLAAFTGQSLESAVQQLGKTYSGQLGLLSQLVPATRGLTEEQLKNGAAVDIIAAAYRGAAESQTQTFSGALTTLGNAFDDVTKIIGNAVVGNQALITVFSEVAKSLFGFAQGSDSLTQSLSRFVTSGVVFTIKAISGLVTGLDFLIRGFQIAIEPVLFLADGILAVSQAITAFLDRDFEIIGELLAAPFERSKETINELLVGETGLTALSTALDEIAIKAEENADKELDNSAKVVQSAQAKASLVKQSADSETAARKKAANEQAKIDQKASEERIANLQSTLGTIGSLTSAKSVELFRIGQAAAIANATIDGFAAVQKALASAPPPFNFILAGLVGAATASNIANIASQAPPALVTGSEFVTGPAGIDNVPAFLTRGERVFTTDQNQDFTRFLATEGNNSNLLNAILGRLESMDMGVSVNIGGKSLVNTLQDEINAGLVLNV